MTRNPQRTRPTLALAVEQLEDRSVPSTFTVLSLQNDGAGSLRQAIRRAEAHPGPDVINFGVAGTIRLTNALPAITDNVDIDGTSAPGFAGTPVVKINYNRLGGLQFNAGSAGSALRSLSLINAADAGVTINGGEVLVVGNFIGLGPDGSTVAGNRGNGLVLNGSSGNIIGGTAPQDRNVIAGNDANGIAVNGSSHNQILGNYIGTDATGTLDRGNARNGILVTNRAAGNVIGPGNVISGNDANGVLINGRARRTAVSGNFIGTTAAGNATLGNKRDGVKIEDAHHNVIGSIDPATVVTYESADTVGQPVSAWQGIRGSDTAGQVLIVGTSNDNGLLFDGTMAGVGTSYLVNYPGAVTTSIYGPDNLNGNVLRLVGSYKNDGFETADVEVNGFLFEGTTDDLAQGGNYQTINYPNAKFNYVHSTMGGLAVGNHDGPVDNLPLGAGQAYIYDIAAGTFVEDILYPGALSNTAYGIWHNGGTSYTICGGYSLDAVSNFDDQGRAIGQAYLVDYDSATGIFSNWASFDYPQGNDFVTHFEGISSVENGVYTLNADSVQSGSSNPSQGSFVTVRRNADVTFGPAAWVDLNYTDLDPTTNVTSSNSVYGNQVVGLVIGADGPLSYQATVNAIFQLSNVISGNRGNGISLHGANDNHIAMNYIGADVSGTLDLGNRESGILVTDGAAANLIGGSATGGNNPTGDVFVRPPQGNVISGNDANGVLITGRATTTTLSGNFIGTAASGTTALGNRLDGVAIVNADGNALIGCTIQDNPFVFYNVIGGNGGNGLRVTDSNNTTIQANFFGLGADNDTPVGNALNGVLVEGSSARTLMGGPIPLGNVDAANGRNGLLVRGKASEFTTYNTFCGLAAFSDNPNLGNARDGMRITATGGNILIRTNVITRNGDDGIDISGTARGVRVAGNIVGLNTQGKLPMGNVDNGVEVGGRAHDILIGGPQKTFNIIPHNVISANGGNGVAVLDEAHDIRLNHSYIGTDLIGADALGNANAGVFLGAGTHSTIVGSANPSLLTVISGNLGNGVDIRRAQRNTVIGTIIGADAFGLFPLPNAGNGVFIQNSSDNVIGRTSAAAGGPANLIAFNAADGVVVSSGIRNAVRANSIHSNASLGIDLSPGANRNQAAPVLTSVSTLPPGAAISGTLTSRPKTAFTIEFFANDASEPSGRFYLGSQKVKTNAAGVASFTFYGPLPPDTAHFFTATATDPENNTSEFSAAVA